MTWIGFAKAGAPKFDEGVPIDMFYVYILKHRLDDTLYKGYTSDLKQRLVEHKNKSTRTTAAKGGDYDLVWYCAFPTKMQAIRFESYLKSGSGRAFTIKHLLN